MIRKLRRRLTVILTALTGTMLAAALCFSLWTTVQQVKTAYADLFSFQINYLMAQLYGLESYQPGSQSLEVPQGYYISIEKNGEDLFAASGEDSQREAILFQATEAIKTANLPYAEDAITQIWASDSYSHTESNASIQESSGLPVYQYRGGALVQGNIKHNMLGEEGESVNNIAFNTVVNTFPTFSYKGQTYRAMGFSHTDESGNHWEVLLCESLVPQENAVNLRIWLHAGLGGLGLFLLICINWFLTKLIVKPTEEGLRRQTEFVAAASHELKSPLTVLQSSLSAADIADSPAEAEKYRSRAVREAERMGRLISDLLLLAGSDSKRWALETETFDVDAALIELREQFEAIAREKRHQLRLVMPEETLGEMQGDKSRIHQILAVLLDNALEYSPVDTTVTLGAEIKRHRLCLSVEDQGPGIPAEEKELIFSRFYRADKSRTDKTHFGLGLSVARELATLHGGNLTVEDSPAGGAVFTLVLPFSPETK